jgi:hypothetical protein
MFGLGGSAKKDLTLPRFSVLKKGGSSNRTKNKAFFAFRTIDANFTDSDVDIQVQKESEEQIDFIINLN